jgi:hypothetical protein
MLFILIFTTLFNLPRFFELKTLVIPNCDSFIYLVQPTVLRLSPTYSSITMLSSVIFLNLLPSACLILINKQIYTVVQQKIQIMETLNRRKVWYCQAQPSSNSSFSWWAELALFSFHPAGRPATHPPVRNSSALA